jgi:hypothetical protein
MRAACCVAIGRAVGLLVVVVLRGEGLERVNVSCLPARRPALALRALKGKASGCALPHVLHCITGQQV